MSALTIIFTILQVLSGLAVTVIVLMQSGKSSGLGAVSGAADTFFGKGKAKTWDEKLAKMTKWFALAFVLLTLILNFIK
ncbi:MAG: preprotein translocase subunit SecG [Eubacteriales bacterium]|nr:preprotein translocase subunit SecG [Eubacteriales bacterium]